MCLECVCKSIFYPATKLSRVWNDLCIHCALYAHMTNSTQLTNFPLCAHTTKLQILSDYRPDLLQWLQPKAGVFVLWHMSVVTKMQLEETDLCSIKLIECIQHLSQSITITPFKILGCWVPDTCTVKSAVFFFAAEPVPPSGSSQDNSLQCNFRR
jgi:hypothetical protein